MGANSPAPRQNAVPASRHWPHAGDGATRTGPDYRPVGERQCSARKRSILGIAGFCARHAGRTHAPLPRVLLVLVLRIIQISQLTPPPRFPGEGRDPLLPWAPAFAGEARCFMAH